MDKINNAANYVSETVQGAMSTGSKEANKQVSNQLWYTFSTKTPC